MKYPPYKNLKGETPPVGTITRWAFSDTVINAACPKCGAPPGSHCVSPSGKKAWPPHTQRCSAYSDGIGKEEFKKRHTVKAYTMQEVLERVLGRMG